MTDDKKPPKVDPFAPLPLPETLTGSTKTTKRESAPVVAPAPPEPAAPLPPTAFTARVTGEHEAPVVPFEASAYEAPPEPAPPEMPPPEPPPLADEPAWTEAPALAAPEPASSIVVENELRDAVGATPIIDKKKKKEKPEKKRKRASTESGDDDDGPRGSKMWMFVAAVAVMLGGGITAMILVGRSNSEDLYLSCEADRVVIQQGRSFPPWGTTELEGAEWKSFKIPAEAPCVSFSTESKATLASGFIKLLEGRAKKLVGASTKATVIAASGPDDPVARVDEAEASLKQALLVTRHLHGDDAINKRQQLEHWLGDVTYWRAAARLRAAATALDDAAKQFEAAALQQPEANRDPDAWARHARELANDLRAGPGRLKAEELVPDPTKEPTSKTPAPLGTALPVEPPASGSAAPAPTPDAGVPSNGGGVII